MLPQARRVRDAVSQRCGRYLPIWTYTWAEYYYYFTGSHQLLSLSAPPWGG